MSIYIRDCLKESKDSHGCHSPGGKVIPQIAGPKNCGPECCSTPSTPLMRPWWRGHYTVENRRPRNCYHQVC